MGSAAFAENALKEAAELQLLLFLDLEALPRCFAHLSVCGCSLHLDL